MLHGDAELPNLFFDRKPRFAWHDEQLITGATLQVSIFKDLVTLADPTNRFSFLSYLHEQGRLFSLVIGHLPGHLKAANALLHVVPQPLKLAGMALAFIAAALLAIEPEETA